MTPRFRPRNHQWRLALLPTALWLADHAITLAGQPAAYWAGDFASANEGSPLFNYLLRQHPLAFELGNLGWAAGFWLLICWAPRPVAMTLSTALVLGHTWGISTWLAYEFSCGYGLMVALFLVSAALMTWAWEASSRPAPGQNPG